MRLPWSHPSGRAGADLSNGVVHETLSPAVSLLGS
jgi:hypothetical protein